jgi:hypothetical protein
LKAVKCAAGTFTHHIEGKTIVNDVDAIITVERLELLRDWLKATSNGPRSTVRPYLLGGGRLKGPCGHTLSGITSPHKHDIYRCLRRQTEGAGVCDTPNVRCDDIEQTIWTSVAQLLSDPVRLEDLTGRNIGAALQRVFELDGEISQLERSIEGSDRYREAGLDETLLQRAVAVMAGDLTKLRHQRSLALRASQQASKNPAGHPMWTLAETFASTAATFDRVGRQRVGQVIDLRVRITGFSLCRTCGGSGSTAAPGTGRRPPANCPTCNRTRRTPHLTINGLIPEATTLYADADLPRHPFTITT